LKYLLDTNIVSELISKRPNEKVLQYLQGIEEDHLYLSVVTIGEVKFGIDRLPESVKKEKLFTWLQNDLLERFENRIAEIDIDIMLKWGHINALLSKKGRPLPIMDALIASTALTGNYILITRNEKDFKDLGIQIVNPFR